MSDKTPLSVTAPKPEFCPYCGNPALVFRMGVPRCMYCRAVFFLMFSRYTRKPKRTDDE